MLRKVCDLCGEAVPDQPLPDLVLVALNLSGRPTGHRILLEAPAATLLDGSGSPVKDGAVCAGCVNLALGEARK